MNRIVAIAACGLSLAACSSMPSLPSFELPRSAPAATTIQFESEPAGAEAKTSTGQTCRTPCALSVASSDFTVSFALPGYQPQTVPVKITQVNEPPDPNTGETPAARLAPNPVYVELQPAAPPATARRPAPRKPAAAPARAAAPRAAPQAAPPPAPAPAPASPWPPPPPPR